MKKLLSIFFSITLFQLALQASPIAIGQLDANTVAMNEMLISKLNLGGTHSTIFGKSVNCMFGVDQFRRELIGSLIDYKVDIKQDGTLSIDQIKVLSIDSMSKRDYAQKFTSAYGNVCERFMDSGLERHFSERLIQYIN